MSSVRINVLAMIERAEDQGYRTVDKGSGTWMVYAPEGRAINPEYRVVTIHMPRSDGGNATATIKSNLRRAGVRFDDAQRLAELEKKCCKTRLEPSELAEFVILDRPSNVVADSHKVPMMNSTAPAIKELDPTDELCKIFNEQADLAARAMELVETLRKRIREKTARSDDVLAAFELLRKATDSK